MNKVVIIAVIIAVLLGIFGLFKVAAKPDVGKVNSFQPEEEVTEADLDTFEEVMGEEAREQTEEVLEQAKQLEEAASAVQEAAPGNIQGLMQKYNR